MKVCRTCKIELPDESFDWRGGSRAGTQADCKPCSRKKLKDHRAKMRSLVGRWKMIKGCSHCDFKAELPFQLDLDHIKPNTKTNKGNSRAFEPSWSKKRIKEELRKCQVLCKNCHALKTFKEKDHL